MSGVSISEILPHFHLKSAVEAFNDACFYVFVLTDIELNSQVGESFLKGHIQELCPCLSVTWQVYE